MIINRPKWAFTDHYLFQSLLMEEQIQIYALEGLDHHWDLLPSFPPSAVLLVFIPFTLEESDFRFAAVTLERRNPDLHPRGVVWLCNYPAQIEWARSFGFDAILCHHNAFIDEDIFKVAEDDGQREFDLVINTRPERVKRPWLAAGIERLAVIKGNLYNPGEYYDLTQLAPAWINDQRLTLPQVQQVYRRSNAGGIFSAAEGGCLASGEYLLSGLPVLSTPSKGGRDTYYTEFNSVIVEPTNHAVRAGLALILEGLRNGRFDRRRIRDHHRMLSDRMREGLRLKLASLLSGRVSDPPAAAKGIVRALQKRRVYWLPRDAVIEQIRHARGSWSGPHPRQRFLDRRDHAVVVTGTREIETRRQVLHLTPTRTFAKHFVSFVFDLPRATSGWVRSLVLDIRSGGYPYAIVEVIQLARGAEHSKVAARVCLRFGADPLPPGWRITPVTHGLDTPAEYHRLEIPVDHHREGDSPDALDLRVYVDSHGEYLPTGQSSISVVSPLILNAPA